MLYLNSFTIICRPFENVDNSLKVEMIIVYKGKSYTSERALCLTALNGMDDSADKWAIQRLFAESSNKFIEMLEKEEDTPCLKLVKGGD